MSTAQADPEAVVQMTPGSKAPWSDHRSGMLIQFGVSGELSGSKHVFMTRQKIPAGMRSTPHFHTNCETAIYIAKGPIVMRYGMKLEHEHRVETGDFLFLPQNSMHQIVNPSPDDEAEVVLCRNAADELVEEAPELD